MKNNYSLFKKTLFLASIALLPFTGWGQNYQTWGGASPDILTTGAKWTAASTTDACDAGAKTSTFSSGSIAYFCTGSGSTATGTISITCNGIIATESHTQASGSGTLNFNAGVRTIDVASGKTLDFGTGTGFTTTAGNGINKTGLGAFSMVGTSNGIPAGFTLTDGTYIARGSFSMGGNATTGSGSLTINGGTLAVSTTIDFTSTTRRYSSNITIGGDFTIGSTVSPASGSANITFGAGDNVNLGGTTKTITNGGASGVYTFNNIFTSTGGGLTFKSLAGVTTGKIVLGGVNTYTALTTINGGTLEYGVNDAIAGDITVGATAADATSAVLSLLTFNETVAILTVDNGGSVTSSTGVLTATSSFEMKSATTVSAILAGAVPLNKTTAGSVTLAGNNTYTGTTTVGAGTLIVSGTNASGAIVLNGGELRLNSASRFTNTSATLTLNGGAFRDNNPTTGNSQTLGTLTLTENSTIALGTTSHTLTFAASHLIGWTASKILTITGWTGTIDGASSGTAGKLNMTSGTGLTATQLAQIKFSISGVDYPAVLLGTGEVVPNNIFYSLNSSDVTSLSNWNSQRNGSGFAPTNFTSGSNFVVQNTHSMTTSGDWTVSGTGNKIQIESGGTLTATAIVATTTFQIDGGGTYVHNAVSGTANGVATDLPGTTTRAFAATSTVEFQKWANGGTPVALPSVTWGNLTINVATLAAGWQQAAAITTVNGNLIIAATGGGTNELRLTAGSALTLNIAGNLVIQGGVTDFATTGTTVDRILNLTGSYIQSGGTFKCTNSSNALVMNVSGDWTNNGGTFTPGASTVVFNSTAANQAINGSQATTTFNHVTVNKTGRILSVGGSVTSVVCNSNLTITAGAFTAPASLNIGGIYSNSGTFTHNSGTVTFNTTGAGKTLSGTLTGATGRFNNLTFNHNTGAWSFSSNADVVGILTISDGTVTSPAALSVGGDFSYSSAATFTHNSGTITFNGTSTILGTGTLTLNNVTISGTLTGKSTNFNVAGNWVNTGTYTHNSGTVTFTGTTTISGASTTTFYNVTISGTLIGKSAANFNVANNWSNSGTFTHNNGTVTFTATGSGKTITGNTAYYDITFNGTGGVWTMTGTSTFYNYLTLTAGNFTLGATNTITSTYNFSRFIFNGGTFSTGGFTNNFDEAKWQVNEASTFVLGGGSHTITFQKSNSIAGDWTTDPAKVVTVTGWTSTTGRIFSGLTPGLLKSQLNQIKFSIGGDSYPSVWLVSGEVKPEPNIGIGSGNWSDPATWSNGIVPTTCDVDVSIGSNKTIVVDIPNAACNDLEFKNTSNSKINFSIATGVLTICGHSSFGSDNDNILTWVAGAKLAFGGNRNQTLTTKTATRFRDIEVNKTDSTLTNVSSGTTVRIGNSLAVNGGTLTLASGKNYRGVQFTDGVTPTTPTITVAPGAVFNALGVAIISTGISPAVGPIGAVTVYGKMNLTSTSPTGINFAAVTVGNATDTATLNITGAWGTGIFTFNSVTVNNKGMYNLVATTSGTCVHTNPSTHNVGSHVLYGLGSSIGLPFSDVNYHHLTMGRTNTNAWILAADRTIGGRFIVNGGTFTTQGADAAQASLRKLTVTGTTAISVGDLKNRQVNFVFNSPVTLTSGILDCGTFGTTVANSALHNFNAGIVFAGGTLFGTTASTYTTINIAGNVSVPSGSLIGVSGASNATAATFNIMGGLTRSGAGVIKASTVAAPSSTTLTTINLNPAASGNLSVSTGLTAEEAVWRFNVAAGKTIVLQSDIELGGSAATAPTFTDFLLASGSTLTMGTNIVRSNTSGTVATDSRFTHVTDATIEMGRAGGITLAGTANGNVQTVVRTFVTTGHYTYNGSIDQVTGTGLPASCKNLIINMSDNTKIVTLTNPVSVGSNACSILSGIFDIGTNGLSGATGTLNMSAGTLLRISKIGTGVVLPEIDGTYNLTGGTVELYGAGRQVFNGGKTFNNILLTGDNVGSASYVNISSGITVNGEFKITGANTIFDAVNNAGVSATTTIADGPTGKFTMTAGRYRTLNVSQSVPHFGPSAAPWRVPTVSLTGGTVELYGTSATQQQTLKGGLTYFNVDINATVANVVTSNVLHGDLVTGSGSPNNNVTIDGTFTIYTPAVFSGTSNRNLVGTGTFTMQDGSGLKYGDANGITIASVGTGSTAGYVRTTNRTYASPNGNYGFLGAVNMVSGNGLPAIINSLYITKTGSGAPATVTLSKSLTVSDSVVFTRGIVVVSVDSVFLLANSTPGRVTNPGGNRSYVNGVMKRNITSNTGTYLFPVGTSNDTINYRKLEFLNNSLTGTTRLDVSVGTITEGGNNSDSRIVAEQGGVLMSNVFEQANWKIVPDADPTGGTYGINLYILNLTGLSAADDNKFATVQRPQASTDYADWKATNCDLSATTIPSAGSPGRVYNGGAGYAQRTVYNSFCTGGANFAVAVRSCTAGAGLRLTTSPGGDWNNPATWVSGVVPPDNYSVQIDHPVNLTAEQGCLDLLINSGGSITGTNKLILTGSLIANASTSTLPELQFNTTAFAECPQSMSVNGTINTEKITINNANGVSITGASSLVRINNLLTLSQGVFTTNGKLILDTAIVSGVIKSATIAGTGTGTISGDVTLKRYYDGSVGCTNNKYIHVATPVTQSLDDWKSLISSGAGGDVIQSWKNVFKYDEAYNDSPGATDAAYVPLTTAANMEKGKGYFIYLLKNYTNGKSTFTNSVSGAVSLADYTWNLEYTDNSSTTDGYNMLGNPLPGALDANIASANWSKTGSVDGTVYIWNGCTKSYASTSGGFPVNGHTGEIPYGSAFWVKANDAGQTLTLKRTALMGSTGAIYKKAPVRNAIKIAVSNGIVQDQTGIRFHDDGSTDFDNNLDAKQFGFPEMNIYSELQSSDGNKRKYAINTLPFGKSGNGIPLKHRVASTGKYKLLLTGIEVFDESTCIYVIDKKMGTIINPRITEQYEFTEDKSTEYKDRFEVRTYGKADPTIVAETCGGDAKVVVNLYDVNSTYSFYNSRNELIKTGNTKDSAVFNNLKAGNYSVTLKSNDFNCPVAKQEIVVPAFTPLQAKFSRRVDATCGLNNGIIKVEPIGGNQPYSYEWSNEATTNEITGLRSGLYSVTIKDVKGCAKALNPVSIANVIVKADFVLSSDLLLINKSSILNAVNKSQNASSYVWSFGNGNLQTTKTPTAVKYDKEGEYVVKLVVSTENNCIDSLSRKVTVRKEVVPFSKDIINVYQQGNLVIVKPNSNFNGTIDITDAKGGIIYSGKHQTTAETTIETNMVSNATGVYFVKLSDGVNQTTKKIILVK